MASVNATVDRPLPSLTFLYHELRPYQSKYSYALACEDFAQQLALFARSRQLARAGGGALWPEISFDDGHLSNHEYALPGLTSYDLAAHFFITVGWTGTTGYMGWPELRELHGAGQRIGAHGWTHSLLTHCGASQLHRELGDARRALEDGLGCAVTSMSLPGGRYNRRVLAACQAAGYTEVFTSIPRAEAATRRPLVGRVNVRAGMSLAALEQLLQPGGAALAKMERVYRVKAAAKSLLGDQLYTRVWALVNGQEPDAEPGLIPAP